MSEGDDLAAVDCKRDRLNKTLACRVSYGKLAFNLDWPILFPLYSILIIINLLLLLATPIDEKKKSKRKSNKMRPIAKPVKLLKLNFGK